MDHIVQMQDQQWKDGQQILKGWGIRDGGGLRQA
jgi:hypothetical protein